MTASDPALLLDGVSIRYGARSVCQNLGLAVAPGTFYALLGRNGSGKTSIVRTILGLQTPARGRVSLLGGDPSRERTRLLREVGYVPETPEIPPSWSAREAARFVAPLYPDFDRRDFQQRLERRAIDPRRPLRALSRGERTGVCLALALAQRPALLVLDDPTLGLDAAARRELWRDLVDELAGRGTTVLVTSHDLAGIETIATHAGILHDGALRVDEEIERLKGRFRRLSLDQAAADRLRAAPLSVIERAPRSFGESWITDAFGTQHAQLAALSPPIEIRPLSLEEIFLCLTAPPPRVAPQEAHS